MMYESLSTKHTANNFGKVYLNNEEVRYYPTGIHKLVVTYKDDTTINYTKDGIPHSILLNTDDEVKNTLVQLPLNITYKGMYVTDYKGNTLLLVRRMS